jgi:hypothetical protein
MAGEPQPHLHDFSDPDALPSLSSFPSPFKFVGTNAYWIPFLNSDDDISKTFADMAATGITVVRTWAFNGADLPF